MPDIPFTNIYPDGPVGSEAAGGTGASSGNDQYPGMPAGAVPVNRDIAVATAGTVAVWTPQTGNRFVLTAAFISTDTAMRVALVDESDVQGSRPVAGYFAASGGASPNRIPVPYPSRQVGNTLRLVTAAAGNVLVSVAGWEVAG